MAGSGRDAVWARGSLQIDSANAHRQKRGDRKRKCVGLRRGRRGCRNEIFPLAPVAYGLAQIINRRQRLKGRLRVVNGSEGSPAIYRNLCPPLLF